jgi:hypothetical protein
MGLMPLTVRAVCAPLRNELMTVFATEESLCNVASFVMWRLWAVVVVAVKVDLR